MTIIAPQLLKCAPSGYVREWLPVEYTWKEGDVVIWKGGEYLERALANANEKTITCYKTIQTPFNSRSMCRMAVSSQGS